MMGFWTKGELRKKWPFLVSIHEISGLQGSKLASIEYIYIESELLSYMGVSLNGGTPNLHPKC